MAMCVSVSYVCEHGAKYRRMMREHRTRHIEQRAKSLSYCELTIRTRIIPCGSVGDYLPLEPCYYIYAAAAEQTLRFHGDRGLLAFTALDAIDTGLPIVSDFSFKRPSVLLSRKMLVEKQSLISRTLLAECRTRLSIPVWCRSAFVFI